MSGPIETQEDVEDVVEDTSGASAPDFDNMSDEDFLKFDPSTTGIGAPEGMVSGPAQTLEAKLDAEENDEGVDDALEEEAAKEGEEVPKEGGVKKAPASDVAPESDAPKQEEKPAAPAADPETAPNFEELYKQIMRPFKANGKEFAPASPDEAVRLMQMGVNYTKKMQSLAPSLKLMRMLENNGLLDENKLTFLIDLDKKSPAAISKLLHDGKIDPLDLDVSSTPAYTPGNHSVSDQEMAFYDVLGTVMTTPTGKETVSLINSGWDHDSKQAIFREPKLLAVIDEQRSNGIYAKITSEIDRRRILGDLQGVPFISAYKQVGDDLHKAGQLHTQSTPLQGNPAQDPAPGPVLDTRPAVRKPVVANQDKARAISDAPKATTKATAARAFDPFSATDEEIMQITSLRV